MAALVVDFGQQISGAWGCTVPEFWMLHGFKMEADPKALHQFKSKEDVRAFEQDLRDKGFIT